MRERGGSVVLVASIVNIAMPSMQADLGISDADRQWIVTAYTLTFGSMLLLGAVFAAQTVAIFGTLGWFAGGIGARLQQKPALAVWLDRCAGPIFFLLALHLATSGR